LESSKIDRAANLGRIAVRCTLAAVLTAQLLGCAMPVTPPYTPHKRMGEQYCADLAQRAQLVSTQEMGVGIFMLTVAGASITASGAVGTINGLRESPSEALAYLGGGLAVLPLLAVPFGMVLLSRSDEASALSATANTSLALSEDDADAYRSCALAKASWVGSRTDATALAREAMSDDKKKKKKKKGDEADDDEPTAPAPASSAEPEPEPSDKVMARVRILLQEGRVKEAQKLLEKRLEGSTD
jgi:hypothetical protein